MRIRRIHTLEGVKWVAPVLSPSDLRVATTAANYIEIARQQARQIIEEAHESAEAFRCELRNKFIAENSGEFREFLESCRTTLQGMESSLHSYARDVAAASIRRLDVLLESDEKLDCALRQVVADLLPGLQAFLVVPEGKREIALDRVRRYVDSGSVAGLRLTVEESSRLRPDEVSLRTADGAQITCAFEDMVNQLLSCVE